MELTSTIHFFSLTSDGETPLGEEAESNPRSKATTGTLWDKIGHAAGWFGAGYPAPI